ncbi:MAG: 5-oxoprolinase [Alphaproteobacteria bacterium]|nr:5-oxoprolinase [Alphaproteobacteria bacterium]
MLTDDRWQFWIDRGGTFTDVVAQSPAGEILSHKLLSENPEQYDDAALHGIRHFLNSAKNTPIPAHKIASVKMGTTVATNALLERKGDRTLLVITKGFRDALRIGYQNRPDLFALHVDLPDMLYEQVVEANERRDAAGTVLTALDTSSLRADLTAAYERGIRAAAVVLMHGYRYHETELEIGKMAQEIGFSQISLSHQSSPLMKLISRGDTTVVDAYLSPMLRRYMNRVQQALCDVPLYFMQSSGGLTATVNFRGKDAILSGPAGGIVGAVKTAAAAGLDRLIGFDMGGTSTDVTHYNGDYERSFDTMVAGVRLRVPMMHIHTVAAGGGSILHYDGSRFRVGPDSAGANPGPAGYRRGGPLTVTDCNILLGRINPDYFPKVFGPDADQPLDRKIVRTKFQAMADQMPSPPPLEQIAEGFLAIAAENMAAAIKKISTQRGYDVSQYTLVSFGGAGGQHACLVADRLGMGRIFLHPLAGVLSAYGMGLADLSVLKEQAVEQILNAHSLPEITRAAGELSHAAEQALRDQNVTDITVIRKVYIKYQGSDSSLSVPLDSLQNMIHEFERQHRQQFGFISPDKPLIVEQITVEAIGGGQEVSLPPSKTDMAPASPIDHLDIYIGGCRQPCPVYQRRNLAPAQAIPGPAIILEDHGTNIIEDGWQGQLDQQGNLILERMAPVTHAPAPGTDADPIRLEIFNNLFMSIAEQMGAVLEKVAHSVNMKERLDFSCALFDGDGHLVANAPHMPVHLGSMGASVKRIITANRGQMTEGDSFLLNDPYNGGTHLPDMTVITPYFRGDEKQPLFYLATRGHHADIGGISPGSMPPHSRNIEEEGILFDNFPLVRQGEFQEGRLLCELAQGPYPARNPAQNIADLKAQIAANEKGRRELDHMVEAYGVRMVQAYMKHVQDNAEDAVRRAIQSLKSGHYDYPLDNGAHIKLAITIDTARRTATIDFTGTSDQMDNNFNAPLAICRAAVLYVFRCLVGDDIPLNEGCLKPLNIIVPEGSLLSPKYPAAVVAGNVETSQAVVNCLFLALDVMAASQGTMNNFTFGNKHFQYYETLAGGMGATANHDGASAVQSHMTNSRLTDPEVLEWRYPVILDKFEIRAGSGGKGRHAGGDGIIRHLRFMQPMTAAILSNHRTLPPPGLDGGGNGTAGRNQVLRTAGHIDKLSSAAETDMQPGDVFVIETPGGGAYGRKMKPEE